MVTLRALTLDDAPALTRIYSGASVRHTTGRALPLDQAEEKVRSALARAAETPRAQWSWGILAADEMIGLIALRRRSPVMGPSVTSCARTPGATATPPTPPSHVGGWVPGTSVAQLRKRPFLCGLRPAPWSVSRVDAASAFSGPSVRIATGVVGSVEPLGFPAAKSARQASFG
ncbi:GNAT family N-acetyltransferase [Streptomyces globosus]|uniref:GNAT family N-acetyltransferase n=1 Tax=Streptomyces globosus TaxID=68209 RepID=UPI003806DA94